MYILYENFCDSKNIQMLFKFLGNILDILHILIPIIIIIFAIIDLVKVIILKDNKNYKLLIKRFIMAIMIFFLISIIIYILNVINNNYQNKCFNCFLEPDSCVIKDNSINCNNDECCKNNYGDKSKYSNLSKECVESLSKENQY